MATLKAMFKLFDGYSTTIQKINKKTDEAANKLLKASGNTDKFNKKLNDTGASANNASNSLGKFISIAALVGGAIKSMNIADEFTNTAARLNLINDGLQTQAELQEKIFAAANRSKGAYTDMASAISKMGLMAGENFSSNDELIAFTELLQKSFKVGGASTSEQSSAMLQLTQAMSAGILQGDEFRSIMENAPLIAEAIAKYVGVGKGELKELSADGAITSDIIKNAMFAAGDDINAKFETMPTTFADVWNRIKNAGLQAFEPVINSVNKIINTTGFQAFVNTILTGLNIIGSVLGGLIDFIVDIWPVIGPILTAIAIVGLGGIITKLWAMIPPLMANVAGWLLMNAPMILIIATIFFAIQALGSLGVTFQDVFSFIGGVLGIFVAFFGNQFIAIWNVVAEFVNFFGNVFKNPVASVQVLFYNLAINVLGFIEKMAQGIEDLINKIPGVEVSITSGISSLKHSLSNKAANIKSEAELVEFVKSKEFIDYSSAYNKGADIGSGVFGKISSAFSGFGGLGDITSDLGFDMSEFGTPGNPVSVEGTGKNGLVSVEGTGKNGAVQVDMADEDLKYLRDIAEREYINKFSTKTLAPQISVQFGDVRETADVDQVAKRIGRILKEQIEIAGEGIA